MLALSTAWNADKWQDGESLAREIFDLGVTRIELNFSLTQSMVDAIARFSRSHGITITSLHNYCPIPEGLKRQEALPDCFSLSSLNEDERKKAVAYTKLTIATAQKLCARVVVLHTGRVDIEDKTRELIALYNKNESRGEAYKEIFDNFVRERQCQSAPYFSQLLKSLKTLCAYATQLNIKLGIENRFYFREIPSLDEFAVLFNTFKNDPITYWHDVGHAYIHEKLGFIKTNALLDNYHHRLSGMHLHNIKNLCDHQAPTDGDFDFLILKPYVKKDTLRVIEAHKQATPESIKKSLTLIAEAFRA